MLKVLQTRTFIQSLIVGFLKNIPLTPFKGGIWGVGSYRRVNFQGSASIVPPFLIAVLGWSLALLSSCGGNVQLDNARGEKATISIGADDFELNAGEKSWINLEPGDHHVKVTDARGGTFIDTTIHLQEGGVIHSGGSSYWVWRRLYGMQKDRKTLLHEEWAETDSTRLYGDLKMYSPRLIFIEKNWDFGLEDEMPESIKLYSTSDFMIKSKVFREKDLIETYQRLSKAPE